MLPAVFHYELICSGETLEFLRISSDPVRMIKFRFELVRFLDHLGCVLFLDPKDVVGVLESFLLF
jgi:hypothetical protein